MLFRQILHEDLGCASYLIADGGEAIVVDPRWEIDAYLQAAAEAGAEIRHVVETHQHADHVSGRRRLVVATGAEAHLPADPQDPRDPQGPEGPGLREGDVIRVGATELRAIAAPGHRPEHLAFTLVTRGDPHTRLLTGDSLLVGAIARPDLAVAAEDGADALFDTLRRYKALDPATEVWPAHVGASLCGSGSGSGSGAPSASPSATSSTLADELETNSLLAIEDRTTFARELNAGSPARPPRVAEIVALNRNRAGVEPPPPLPGLTPAELRAALGANSTAVLDIRSPEAFDAGHLAGALNLVPVGGGLGNRAGWATAPAESLVLVAPDHGSGEAFAQKLYAAGIFDVIGIAVADPPRWAADGLRLDTAGSLSPELVAAGLTAGRLELLDVRDPGEYRISRVTPSRNLPLSELGTGKLSELELDPAVHYAVACAGGARAALAASIVRRGGHPRAVRMSGGITALLSAGSGVRDAVLRN